jgi:hypothetical protein
MESLETEVRGLSRLLDPAGAEPPLIAILPHNNAEYALAAEVAGADAIVLGIDKTESTFPGLFGSFDLQEDSISGIISSSSIPVGISIGDSRPLTRENWERIVAKKFSFVNMYAHHMPPFVLQDARMEKLVTIGPGYMVEQIRNLSEMDGVFALEAAIVSAQGMNHVFSVLDLATLRMIAKLSVKPVILRTQKRIEVEDMGTIFDAGLRGISLDPSSMEPGIEAYRDAVSTFRLRGTNGAAQASQ